ncbi:MAG: NAD(P)/FAD-dependent oxidoreductase [Deltaproteobacteria bacterium]|nr:NAD(P)/FAD-dependent oxidoreductase [Deltaproteobacteria bacterium]
MKYDVVIIGGGPAGMIAAGRAGERGARVLLLEKNDRLGVKLLITGHGRCNITNKIDSPREMAEKFGRNGKFLISAFSRFGVREVIGFFESRGVKTKVEKNNRVIAESDRAEDVLDALIDYMEKAKVEVRSNAEVRSIEKSGNRIEKVVLSSGEEVFADRFVICTGGKSYPATGSTGDGFGWAKALGHKVVRPAPSLTPVILKDAFVKELEGLSLRDVRISAYKDNKKFDSGVGEAVFTAKGMSGPLIINMSKGIGKELPGEVALKIDLVPDLDFTELDARVRKDLQEGPHRQIKNCLDMLLPQKLVPVITRIAGIDPGKKANCITKEERKKLVHLMKEFGVHVAGLPGFERAVITAGGVELGEVDSKTMRSKLIENLYFAGEVLDLDGPTGGYNLQVCWSTGYCAGEAAAVRP